jgi:hypothetical protein
MRLAGIVQTRDSKSTSVQAASRTSLVRVAVRIKNSSRKKLSRGHHAALPYQEIPEFVGKLRERVGVAAL